MIMVYITNGVFLIGLLSLLSLDAADEFSDGVANYVQVDWVEEKKLEDNIMDDSIVYDYDFKLEIFTIKGEDKKCLYKVVRTSVSPPEPPGQFTPRHLAKASCALNLFTLSDVVRVNVKNDHSVEYRQKGNSCLHLVFSTDDVSKEPTTDYYHCKEMAHIPESAALEPDDKWMLKFPRSEFEDGVIWGDDVSFTVFNKQGNNTKCLHKGLWVGYRVGEEFMPFKQLKMSCELDVHSLHRVVKRIGSDTLVYKLQDDQCFRSQLKYDDTKNKVLENESQTFKCDKFLNPVTDK